VMPMMPGILSVARLSGSVRKRRSGKRADWRGLPYYEISCV
jgi:hypothetical protein